MKKTGKIMALLVVALAFFLMALPAQAQNGSSDLVVLEGNASGLVFLPADGKLFDLQNMCPGDTEKATLEIRNNYDRWYDLSLRLEDVSEENPSLFEVLSLKVTYRDQSGDQLFYEGRVDKFAEEPISLGRYYPGDKGYLEMEVELPGPETTNEYQGKSASIKWIFSAQAPRPPDRDEDEDEPSPRPRPEPPEEIIVPLEEPPRGEPELPEEPPEVEVPEEPVPKGPGPEMPKTGEGTPYPYYLLGALALLAGVKLVSPWKRK